MRWWRHKREGDTVNWVNWEEDCHVFFPFHQGPTKNWFKQQAVNSGLNVLVSGHLESFGCLCKTCDMKEIQQAEPQEGAMDIVCQEFYLCDRILYEHMMMLLLHRVCSHTFITEPPQTP